MLSCHRRAAPLYYRSALEYVNVMVVLWSVRLMVITLVGALSCGDGANNVRRLNREVAAAKPTVPVFLKLHKVRAIKTNNIINAVGNRCRCHHTATSPPPPGGLDDIRRLVRLHRRTDHADGHQTGSSRLRRREPET